MYWNNNNFNRISLGCDSEWLTFSPRIWNRGFRTRSCIYLTDINAISDALTLRRPENSQVSVDVQRVCNGLPKLRTSLNNVFRLSVIPYWNLIVKCSFSFRKSLYKLHVSLESNNGLGKVTISIVMPVSSSFLLSARTTLPLIDVIYKIFLMQFSKICRNKFAII